MLYKHRTPYTVSCKGLWLDKSKVYAISNYDRISNDTIFVHFLNSKVLMPSTLGYLYFDGDRKEFTFKNHKAVALPNEKNPMLPYCKTLNDGFFQKEIYFNSEAKINQDLLVHRGLKFNIAAGDKETRVRILLLQRENDFYLNTNDDGIETEYLVKSDVKNLFGITFNTPTDGKIQYNFMFDNTSNTIKKYTLEVFSTPFYATYQVKNDNEVISQNKGNFLEFQVEEFLFELKPRFSLALLYLYPVFMIIMIVFQVFYLTQITKAVSPITYNLIGFRIAFNSLVLLSVPIFISSYSFSKNRFIYLVLILLLNLTYFFPKDLLHNIGRIKISKRYVNILIAILIPLPFIFKFFTYNESLFGLIPILHVQKLTILLLILVIQYYFRGIKNGGLIRGIIVIGYSLLISIFTSDIGSVIYSSLSIILMELIAKDKSITPKRIAIVIFSLVLLTTIIFNAIPKINNERKFYRLVAPYTSPASENLTFAYEADKESFATFTLNLKNVVANLAPNFNEIIIPPNARSTMFSDFAFHWSLTIGGLSFILLFIPCLYLILSTLVFFLYCSIRECRVNNTKYFIFPKTVEAELMRFLMAFTIISFIYPVFSNLLMIPLTGQSIPGLSISNIEIVFLWFLLFIIESVFTNDDYYIEKKNNTNYSYKDIVKSILYISSIFSILVVVVVTLKLLFLRDLENSLSWKIVLPSEAEKYGQVPKSNSELVKYAQVVIGNDEITEVQKIKKNLLKTVLSQYFTKKPYEAHYYLPKYFELSTAQLLNTMSIDSVFNMKPKMISGIKKPFGNVFRVRQSINGKTIVGVTNDLYKCIPLNAQSTNNDLIAELNIAIENHIQKIGIQSNIGSIMITENASGSIITNSTYPYNKMDFNSNQIYYFVGSVKKILLAYCALAIDSDYKDKKFGNTSFETFIKFSDDLYSANLLKDILQNHQEEFVKILKNDFNLEFASITEEAYMDYPPTLDEFSKNLDNKNSIYRISIGQEKPYEFQEVMSWYSRIASGNKLELNYSNSNKNFSELSIEKSDLDFLHSAMKKVLSGTASIVSKGLESNNLDSSNFYGKTGTAEKADKTQNSSSSFIICNNEYTIGIMLKGSIPDNKEGLAAKNLFVDIIPVLKKYQILNKNQ